MLETERLLLREFAEADWEAVHEYSSDPETVQFMPGYALTEEETRQNIEWFMQGKQHNPPHYDFAIVLKAEGRLIGGCSVMIRYDELHQGELAFALNKRYWGHGYTSEAAKAALDYAFSKLDLHRIFATARPANTGAWRVLEKLGMRREGHLQKHRWMKEDWWDSYLYAILDEEWKKLNFRSANG